MAFDAGAVIGRLELGLQGWKQSVEKVKQDQQSLSGFALRHKDAIQSLGKSFTIAGGAVTTAFGVMIKKTADAGDQINDLSKRTGVSTDVLSAYKLAAEKSGTSIEGLATGLRGLANNMQGAMDKGSPQAQMFKSLGISVTDTEGRLRPLNDVMLDVSDRFAQMPDGPEKAALAMDIFSRSGMEMIPMLNLGRQGLEDEAKAADKLGLIFSKEAAAACDEFNDSIAELKGGMQGVVIQIGTALMPAVKDLIDKVTAVVSSITSWAREHPHLTKALTLTAAAVGSFLLVGGSAIFMLGTFARSIGAVINALPLLKTGMAAIKSQVAAMNLPLSSTGGLLTKIGTVGAAAFIGWEAGRLIGELTGLDGVLQGVFDKTFRLLGIIKETNVEWGEGHTGKEALRQEALARAVEVSGGKVDTSVKAWRILRDEYEKSGTTGSDALDEVVKRQLASKKLTEQHTETVKKQKSALKKLNDALLLYRGQMTADQIAKIRAAIDELTEGVMNAKDKAKSLAEELGITTSSEVQDKLKKLNDALLLYRGQLTADQIAKIRAEIDELSRSTKLSLIPAAEDVEKFTSQTLGNLEAMALSVCREIGKTGDYTVDQMEADLGSIAGKWEKDIPKAAETATKETKNHFDGLYNDIARGFGDTTSGLLGEICKGLNFADMEFFKHGINFKKYFEEAFEGIKQAFFRQIGEMTSEAILDKFKGLFKSVGKSGQDAMSGIANAATGANKVAQGIGQAAGSAASGFLSAAGSIASIVTAVASVADLLKGPQKQTDVTFWLKLIKDLTQEAHDWLFINAQEKLNYFAEKLEDIKIKAGDMVYTRLDAVCVKLDWIGRIGEGIQDAIGKLKGAQFGAVLTSPQLVMTHGTPTRPEYIIPEPDLRGLMATAQAGHQAGGAGGGANIQLTFRINAIDGDSVEKITRTKIVPILQNVLDHYGLGVPMRAVKGY